jgi:hypothetical protein
MELRCRTVRSGAVSRSLLLCVALLIGCSTRVQSDSKQVPMQGTQPSSSAPSRLFLCIQSRADRKNRVAVLQGPDWVLESSIEPSCFPERDVVFSHKEGTGIMPHPFGVRTRIWVTKVDDFTNIRIVASSGSDEDDMVSVSFVTNHKCIDRRSQNCSVKGGAVPFMKFD